MIFFHYMCIFSHSLHNLIPPVSRCRSGNQSCVPSILILQHRLLMQHLHNNLAPNSFMYITVLFVILCVHINRAVRGLWVWFSVSPLSRSLPFTFLLWAEHLKWFTDQWGKKKGEETDADTQHTADGVVGGVFFPLLSLFFSLLSKNLSPSMFYFSLEIASCSVIRI